MLVFSLVLQASFVKARPRSLCVCEIDGGFQSGQETSVATSCQVWYMLVKHTQKWHGVKVGGALASANRETTSRLSISGNKCQDALHLIFLVKSLWMNSQTPKENYQLLKPFVCFRFFCVMKSIFLTSSMLGVLKYELSFGKATRLGIPSGASAQRCKPHGSTVWISDIRQQTSSRSFDNTDMWYVYVKIYTYIIYIYLP